MKHRLLLGLLTCSLSFPAVASHAEWPVNGVPIVSIGTIQLQHPRMISDGAGGAIVTWDDTRSSTTTDIYAQRIDATGAVQWTANGVALCTAANRQQYTAPASDGAGGAIVAWADYRPGTTTDIYAQRIDATGAVQWTADGVALCTAASYQFVPAIVADGTGGAIVSWHDRRNANFDIYAQRIDASGTVQWVTGGAALCTAANDQLYTTIVSDGAGGAIVAWTDGRDGGYADNDIYVQRIDPSGAVQWAADGIALSTAANDQALPAIVSDGAGGAIVAWRDDRDGNNDIYAQRIDASGAVQWISDGVALCTAANDQESPTIVADGAGGAIVTWYDGRSGNNDIYTQRIDASGVVQWTADGVALCTAANTQYYPFPASDGTIGGAIVTWFDFRNGSDYDVYAQRIDASGAVQWTADGVVVCSAPEGQLDPTIASDGAGGAIVAWQDHRSGVYDVYALRLGGSGTATGVGHTPAVTALAVRPNHPNPFNTDTVLEIGLAAAAPVRIELYDVTGHRLRATELAGVQGWQQVPLAALDDRGAPLASGIYFYRVRSRGVTVTRKMVIMR